MTVLPRPVHNNKWVLAWAVFVIVVAVTLAVFL